VTANAGTVQARLTVKSQLGLSIFWLSLNFQSGAFYAVVIPAQVLLFVSGRSAGSTQQALFLGLTATGGGVVALLVQPVAGAVSDRAGGVLGRRRPYIALGAVGLLLGTLVLAWASSPVPFLLGFFAVQVGGAISTGAYQGLLPDRVPPEQRGAASGFLGLMTIIGTLGSLGAAGLLLGSVTRTTGHAVVQNGLRGFYGLTVLVLLLGATITMVGVRETQLGPQSPDRTALSGGIWSLEIWKRPWRYRGFRVAFVARVAVILGLTVFMTYIEYFLARVEHITHFVQATAVVALLALVGAVASAFLAGLISDRVGRVKLVFGSSFCMAMAALCFCLWPGLAPLPALGLLFGVGFGAYTSVDWALAVDVLPSLCEAGKDMGIWSMASTLPAFLAPALGSLTIGAAALAGHGIQGYRAVFGLAVACFVLGSVAILRVPEPGYTEKRPSTAVASTGRAGEVDFGAGS